MKGVHDDLPCWTTTLGTVGQLPGKKKVFSLVLFFLFLSQLFAISLNRDVCALHYCPDHFEYNPDICSKEKIDSVRKYLPLILRAYESDCHVCTKCGHVLEISEPETDCDDEEEECYCLPPTQYSCACCKREYDIFDDSWSMYRDGQWFSDKNYEPIEWEKCTKLAWYPGYFSKYYESDFYFFCHFLQYCSESTDCKCYWPETQIAGKINDSVYERLRDIIDVLDDSFRPSWQELNAHGKTISLVTHTFFYSQYYQNLLDVAKFIDNSSLTGAESPYLDSIDQTISSLQARFLRLYSECLKMHPHPKIYYEKGMILFHQGKHEEALENVHILMDYAEKTGKNDLLSSEMYLQEGKAYIAICSYDDAIYSLTKAIEKDPKNKKAFFQRSIAYFELGLYDQSLDDFIHSGYRSAPLDPSNKSDIIMAAGLSSGLVLGCRDSAIGLFDSIYSLGHGLWAFSNKPVTASKEVIRNLSLCIQYIKENSTKEILKKLCPELCELTQKWDSLDHFRRGELTGYIIGKYGIDILALKGASQGIRAFEELKKANAILTLETFSRADCAAIIEKATSINAHIKKELRPFTKANYRHNLIVETGFNPPKSIHAHHVFPQERVSQLAKLDINIHDPKYLTWWEETSHLKIAKEYNTSWKEFLKIDRSKEEILEFGKKIMENHGMKARY